MATEFQFFPGLDYTLFRREGDQKYAAVPILSRPPSGETLVAEGEEHGDRGDHRANQGGSRSARLDRRPSRPGTLSRRGARPLPRCDPAGRPPASIAQVAAVVRICAEAKLPIVPQDGNTGLVGGGVPPEDGRNIVLALGRMNRIRAIDPINFTMTVEAGCILADLQQAAGEADRLFPLSLGAEGSCQIGGNLSTNAGGIAVLRYGNTRELTLGLEVVLPDGRIWDGLRGLRKDNTGYDLKQLFIGGEGTLGIITAATLKLFPKPREVETAFLGLTRIEDVMTLFAHARAATADQLTAFELIPRAALDLALVHVPGTIDPLSARYPGMCSSNCRRAKARAASAGCWSDCSARRSSRVW